MRDQWICHQQVVAIRSPRKATWNLDAWRPDVSYAQTVNASCNPGAAKWFAEHALASCLTVDLRDGRPLGTGRRSSSG